MDGHHNALRDAIICANLVIACIERKKRKTFQAFCNTHYSLPIKKFSDLKPQTSFYKPYRKFERIAISEIAATTESFDKTHYLYGKNIVFTGELQSMDRRTAMQKTVNLGGIVKPGGRMGCSPC